MKEKTEDISVNLKDGPCKLGKDHRQTNQLYRGLYLGIETCRRSQVKVLRSQIIIKKPYTKFTKFWRKRKKNNEEGNGMGHQSLTR